MERISRYLIMGASSEVGLAFLRLLEERAAKGQLPEKIEVAVHYCSSDQELRALEAEAKHLSFSYLPCDLSDENQVEELVKQLREMEAPQGFLYLPAGRMKYEKLKKMDIARLDWDYRIQVRALAVIAKEILPAMAKAKFGKAAVMLSECTLGMPPKFMAEYVTVKYAALGLMKALSLEYADKNVNVNGLSPAMMETKFLADIDERFVELNAQESVKKRNATVEEAAQALAFLMSKGSDYMNGVNLNLSGGNRG
ncbi:MAG: SDR family oxidoreductase [Lachnospiraceae bacterium]|nr:SDR family oxidoreductase [Lachnospiraceae bacterium]